MSNANRGRVIRLAQAQAGIPGPAGKRSISLMQRGTLDVAFSLPTGNRQTPHAQDEIYVVIRGRVSCFMMARVTHSSQAIFCSWLRRPSIVSRTSARTSPCGGSSTARGEARSPRRAWYRELVHALVWFDARPSKSRVSSNTRLLLSGADILMEMRFVRLVSVRRTSNTQPPAAESPAREAQVR